MPAIAGTATSIASRRRHHHTNPAVCRSLPDLAILPWTPPPPPPLTAATSFASSVYAATTPGATPPPAPDSSAGRARAGRPPDLATRAYPLPSHGSIAPAAAIKTIASAPPSLLRRPIRRVEVRGRRRPRAASCHRRCQAPARAQEGLTGSAPCALERGDTCILRIKLKTKKKNCSVSYISVTRVNKRIPNQ